ncbi:MAG: hypothetical protein ACLUAR_00840 [Pilosibacter sp.]
MGIGLRSTDPRSDIITKLMAARGSGCVPLRSVFDDIDYGFSRIQMELQKYAGQRAELSKLCGLGILRR